MGVYRNCPEDYAVLLFVICKTRWRTHILNSPYGQQEDTIAITTVDKVKA